MKLWPGFLDRMYWRWYLKRHPYHLAVPTFAFLMRQAQRELVRGISFTVEELKLFKELTRSPSNATARGVFIDVRTGAVA